MKVVVSSNCITAGLTSSLRILLPHHIFVPIPYSDTNFDALQDALKRSEFCFYSGPDEFLIRLHGSRARHERKIIRFPELYFNAFHPDQVYAWTKNGTPIEGATGPYNSAIVLWSWRRGLSVDTTLSFFQPHVLEALGYHDRWDSSSERLEYDYSTFESLNFRDFLGPLQHAGCFMHTVNHPKPAAIAQLARILARQISHDDFLDGAPVHEMVVDGLFNNSHAWAVYPSVADALGLEGAYLFKTADHDVLDLPQFVERSFTAYKSQRVRDAVCHELEWPIYNDVLEPLLQRRSR